MDREVIYRNDPKMDIVDYFETGMTAYDHALMPRTARSSQRRLLCLLSRWVKGLVRVRAIRTGAKTQGNSRIGFQIALQSIEPEGRQRVKANEEEMDCIPP